MNRPNKAVKNKKSAVESEQPSVKKWVVTNNAHAEVEKSIKSATDYSHCNGTLNLPT